MKKVFRAEQKLEALERMQMLGIYPAAINELRKSDRLNRSEAMGFLYWLDEKELKMVKDFEADSGNFVYHVIKSYFTSGELVYSLLFVSPDADEWDEDVEQLNKKAPYVYVYNASAAWNSEFGQIGIRSSFGGLVREW